MELTTKERLSLINQYQILLALNPISQSEYTRIIEILENGYTYEYHKLLEKVGDPLTYNECMEIRAILQIYQNFAKTIKNEFISKEALLTHPEKQVREYAKQKRDLLRDITFSGFYDTDETSIKYMKYAEYLLKTEKEFSSLQLNEEGKLNPSKITIQKYRRMKEKWIYCPDSNNLTLTEVIFILNA